MRLTRRRGCYFAASTLYCRNSPTWEISWALMPWNMPVYRTFVSFTLAAHPHVGGLDGRLRDDRVGLVAAPENLRLEGGHGGVVKERVALGINHKT